MQTVIDKRKADLQFTYLPLFAEFLLDNHLQEFVQEQLHLVKQMNLPLLRYFQSLTDEELFTRSTQSSTEFLQFLAENKAWEQIEQAKKRWLANDLPGLGRQDVVTEDIHTISYTRKQAFIKFIPAFTSDPQQILSLVSEIDRFILVADTELTGTYVSILKDHIDENTHFIKRITETSPGIIYVYDVVNRKEIYTNHLMYEYLGYTSEDLKALGSNVVAYLLHPEDLPSILAYEHEFGNTTDGEIRSIRYRIRNKEGEYRWMRSYESVFRRNAEGNITEKIGIAIDVNKEKLNAEKLKQSEELYKQAQALSHLGNWSWDLASNTLEWTDELYRIHGLDPKDGMVDFKEVAALNHPEDQEKVQTIIQRSRETLEPFEFYYRIILHNGDLRHLHARGAVQTNETGQPVRMIGTLQDVTERQKLIDQLQLSDRLYKEAQALSRIGNWTWIIKENKIFWSDELYRIYGLEPQQQEITFEFYSTRLHPDDREEMFNTIQNALVTKKPYDIYHRIVLQDGTVKHVYAKGQVHLDDQEQPERMTGTAQDVTKELQTQLELKENQLFIEKLADATPALITSYNINTGRYRYISGGLKKILGYDAAIALKEGVGFFSEMIHPDDLNLIMEKNQQAIAAANEAGYTPEGGEPIVEFTYRMRHANGEYRWFQTYGTVFDRNSQGNVEHVLNISIDITERKEMETALSQKNLLLEQSNANLEEFAYVASHDLKEPLRKISIFGDRLLATQYQHLGTEGQFYLEKIIDSSKRMQALITDLLSLSLISGNTTFEQHSLQDILEEAMRALEFKIEEKKAVINVDPLPEAKVVPSQFNQLFQNLLSNSLKFVKEGVEPRITIGYQWMKPHEVSLYKMRRARQYLKITVSDNGIGFDNMFAGKIFAIFQRLQHKDYEGTGIGLAICKKIVENHGGVITASGEQGKGATFNFIIPV